MFRITNYLENKNIIWHISALILFACILRFPTLGISVLDWDETAYSLVAREILQGNWPYSTAFDHKPIGIYLHFAAVMSIGGDNPVATRFLSIIMVSLSAIVVKLLLQTRVKMNAIDSTLFALFFILTNNGLGGLSSNSEHILNFYVLTWCWFSFKAIYENKFYYILSGALMGVAFQTNYLASVLIFGFFLSYITYMLVAFDAKKDTIIRIIVASALTLSGLLFAFLMLLAPLVLWGDINTYFDLQLKFLSGYMNTKTSHGHLIRNLKYFSPFLIILIFGAYKYYRKEIDSDQRVKRAANCLFFILLIGSFAAACASGRYYPHYFLLCLPASVLLIASIVRSITPSKDLNILLYIVLFYGGFMIALPSVPSMVKGLIDTALRINNQQVRYDTPRKIASKSKKYLGNEDKIYVVCAQPVLYQLLNVTPPIIFGFYIHHFNEAYAESLGFKVRDKVSEILSSNPKLIVLGNYNKCTIATKMSDWTWLNEQIKNRGYHLKETIDEDFNIFVKGT